MMTDYDIFISYRRVDSEGKISGRDIARLLCKELKLYGYNTFFDYSELQDDDFAEKIIPAVRNCKFFILVLTKDALNRCANEGDWVRTEIEEAIHAGRKIIPVNPDNSFNGWPENLPETLSSITTKQISSVDMNSNFEITVKHMIDVRIAKILPPRFNVSRINSNRDMVSFQVGEKTFNMTDQFFNCDVYNALVRSYGKNSKS